MLRGGACDANGHPEPRSMPGSHAIGETRFPSIRRIKARSREVRIRDGRASLLQSLVQKRGGSAIETFGLTDEARERLGRAS